MRLKASLSLFVLTVLLFGPSFSLPAQEGRGKGRIRGTVQDTRGNPLLGVKISAQHLEFNASFEGKSDKKGNWALVGLGTGVFRITASLEGYAPVSHEMRVSQITSNNPPLTITMQSSQASSAEHSVPGLEDEEAIALFTEGNRLYEEGETAAAAAQFEEFLRLYPSASQAYINLGNCYRELGEFEKALAAYRSLLSNIEEEKGELSGEKMAAGALAGLGQVHMTMGEMEQAEVYLKQALALFPTDETLAFNIGEICFSTQKPDKAVEYFKLAIEIKPDWGSPHRQLGYAYLNLADYPAALESFRRFLEVAPEDPQAPTVKNLLPTIRQLIKK
jgi:tetratricopeptide (TPR) repeat protein